MASEDTKLLVVAYEVDVCLATHHRPWQARRRRRCASRAQDKDVPGVKEAEDEAASKEEELDEVLCSVLAFGFVHTSRGR